MRKNREKDVANNNYVAGAPFSCSLPRVILRENAKVRPAVAELLFSHGPLPYESELSTVEYHTKKALNVVECFCFGVIRTGFEPVTHSLEGCCSIQLSYRTIPFEGAKI